MSKKDGADNGAGAATGAAPARPLLTKRQYADAIGVTPRTVERWAASGKITPGYTPGGDMRFTQQHVDAVLNGSAWRKRKGAAASEASASTPADSAFEPDMGDLLTTGEVMALLRVSRGTVANWIRLGKIEYVRTLSGRYRFDRDKILQPSVNGAAPRLRPKPKPKLSREEEASAAHRWVREKLLRRSLRMRKFSHDQEE